MVSYIPFSKNLNSLHLVITSQCLQRLSNLFNHEKRTRFINNYSSIRASDLKNVSYYFLAVLTALALIEQIHYCRTLTFCLLIEKPFVDFDPFQTCLLNGLTAGLARHLALILFKDLAKSLKLILAFVLANCLPQFFLRFRNF